MNRDKLLYIGQLTDEQTRMLKRGVSKMFDEECDKVVQRPEVAQHSYNPFSFAENIENTYVFLGPCRSCCRIVAPW